MNKEATKWCKSQDVIKITAVKNNEKDNFVLTIGEDVITPHVFEEREEAEKFIKENVKLTNLDFSIIGAISKRINELINKNQKS